MSTALTMDHAFINASNAACILARTETRCTRLADGKICIEERIYCRCIKLPHMHHYTQVDVFHILVVRSFALSI